MKFIKLCIVFLLLTTLAESRKIKDINPADIIDGKVYPTKVKKDLPAEVINNASLQVEAARELLYKPNQVVRNQLAPAAAKLIELLPSKEETELNAALTFKDINRAISDGGIAAGKGLDGLKTILENVSKLNDENENPAEIGNDIATFLSFTGDVAGCLLDYSKNKANTDQLTIYNGIVSKKLATILATDKSNPDALLENLLTKVSNIKVKKGSVAPKKSVQRGFTTKPLISDLADRAGILGEAKNAEEKLVSKKQNDKKLTNVKWPEQTIPVDRVKSSKEPWAGHISTSIFEMQILFDLLLDSVNSSYQANPELVISYTKDTISIPELNSEQRRARAAITSAVFMALGYHSAVELMEIDAAYLGHNYREEANKTDDKDLGAVSFLNNGNSTKFMICLMTPFTKDGKACTLEFPTSRRKIKRKQLK